MTFSLRGKCDKNLLLNFKAFICAFEIFPVEHIIIHLIWGCACVHVCTQKFNLEMKQNYVLFELHVTAHVLGGTLE